jgi:hypothetical protein
MKRLVAAFASVIAVSAYADTNSNSGFYVGLGVSEIKSDLSAGDNHKIDFETVEVLGGYKLNPYVGGEVRLGSSVGGRNTITDFESVYYRVESANTVGKTYLLVGGSRVNMDSNYGGTLDLIGFSYGAGAGFVINDRFNLNLEYKVLAKGTAKKDSDSTEYDVKLSSLSATVDFRF